METEIRVECTSTSMYIPTNGTCMLIVYLCPNLLSVPFYAYYKQNFLFTCFHNYQFQYFSRKSVVQGD